LTEEKTSAVISIDQYLASDKPHDLNFVNVPQDKLLLDAVLNGEEGKGVELLEKTSWTSTRWIEQRKSVLQDFNL